ncbi:MAG: ABC transporter ATP-binding protein [Chloroflexota bacterium]|nr:ABC transporter ATP-binding protein [Chloroflexota bacterium]
MTTARHPTHAIAAENLTKRYGSIEALKRLDLTVPTGSIYGFLGPNGAGKTTTIRLLMGFIRPSIGRASIFGCDTWHDGVAARRDVGYLVPPDSLFPDLTGRSLLDFAAQMSGRAPSRRATILDALELSQPALDRRLGAYSRGMRQKLALTAAMQHDPALLILDEPTESLDPLVQRAFEELLRGCRANGQTVFMSSHDLPEIERTCERVAVIRDGHLVAEETIETLKRHYRRVAEVVFRGPVPDSLLHIPNVTLVKRHGNRVELAIDGDVVPLLRFLAAREIDDLLLPPPRLEDIFMQFYGDTPQPVANSPAISDLPPSHLAPPDAR